ncbi:MAG: hypothetical protein NXI23_05230 [Bacteroidetes bacterium]|jgi:hypothetical protein|nr:hypothetical protein [Bacteroidota bacterium]MDF1863192.1 hypothetical protein [Saprospiraceae bacterium]
MTHIKNTAFALFVLVLFTFCNNDHRNIKEYYFPIEELKDGKVYEYQSISDERNPPFYWYYQTLEQQKSTFLIGTYYGPDFTQYQLIQEEMVSNGMLLDNFYWFEPDTLNNKQIQVPANIESGSVFGFELYDPPTVLVSSINWRMPSDTLTKMTFIRNRQYDKDTTYSYQNQTYDCVKFYVRELIDNENEGHLEQEYEATEIYAKGIGLIYFRKDIAKDFKMEYELKDIYDMKEFEKKFQISLEK